jgi:NADPH-dependent curcumin reductase CurA
MFGWREYAHIKDTRAVAVTKLPTAKLPGIPPQAYLSVLGMTSLTAYFGYG